MSQRKALFKDVSIYALSAYSAQVLDIINGVLIRRFLGAANMGIWAFLQVFLVYAKHAGLGVTTATMRDVPYHRAKGEYEKADEIKDLVFTFTIATSVIAALVVVIYALLNHHKVTGPFFIGLFVVAVLIILQRVYNLFVCLLRAYKEFVFAGYLNFISSVTSIIFALALTYRFKIYGFFAGLILNFLLSIVLILWRTPHRFRWHFSWSKLKPLIQFGLAILVLDILRSTLLNIDRMVIAKFLGFQELGVYSVALMVNNFIFNFPTLLVAIFPPYFQDAFGKRDRVADLEKTLVIPTLALSYALSLLVGCVCIVIPWLVSIFLPQYVSGISAIRILILGSFFLALTHSLTTFVITIRKHMSLFPITILSIVGGFALNYLFISRGWGIRGVAAGTGLLYTLYFLGLAVYSFKKLFPWSGVFNALLKVFAPFLYTLVALSIVHFLFPTQGHLLLTVVKRFVIFGFLAVPLLFLLEKETGLFSTAREVWFKKKVDKLAKSSPTLEIKEESPDNIKP